MLVLLYHLSVNIIYIYIYIYILYIYISYYNKRNAHFNVQELLLQFWTKRYETWQECGEALGA